MSVHNIEKHVLISKYPTLGTCRLFNGIQDDDLTNVLNCLDPQIATCSKGDIIFKSDTKPSCIGAVLEGSLHLIREDVWGNRSLIEHILPGFLFGESFMGEKDSELNLTVIAAENSSVGFIDYQRIISACPTNCVFHTKLIKNMLASIIEKNIELTRKIEHLSKKTLEEKICSYLSTQAKVNDCGVFDIPFSRSELADYLSVDRASLSRTLSNMQEKELIRFSGNHFEIVDVKLFMLN